MTRDSLSKILTLFLLICAITLLPEQGMAKQGCVHAVLDYFSQPRDAALVAMDGRSIKAVQKLPGRHGGSRYLMQTKFMKGWDSGWNPSAPQGSPLFVFRMLDPDVAEFLGFEKTKEGMIVPDHDELMGAFAKINARRKGRNSPVIKIKLYLEPDQRAPVEKYLLRLATEGELPWAEDGNYFHHDLNFHALSGLMIPTELLQLLRRQLMPLFEFKAFLRNHHPELLKNPKIQRIFKEAFDDVARKIDHGTGAIPQYSELFRSGDVGNSYVAMSVESGLLQVKNLFNHGQSPSSFLSSRMKAGQKLAGLSNDKGAPQLAAEFENALGVFKKLKVVQDPKFETGLPEVNDAHWLKQQLVERAKDIQAEIRRTVTEDPK